MIELTRLHYRKEIATRSRDYFFPVNICTTIAISFLEKLKNFRRNFKHQLSTIQEEFHLRR